MCTLLIVEMWNGTGWPLTVVYKTEVVVWRLVICGVIWAQMSAWRWGSRVWEVNDDYVAVVATKTESRIIAVLFAP